MYKLKYYSLSKEEKNELKKEYYDTKSGKEVKIRLTRVLILGILALVISIYLFYDAKIVFDYIYASMLLIASIFFIIYSTKLRKKKINEYLVSKEMKNKTSKK